MTTPPIYILGISCEYHDSAAVLLRNGEIVFAAQEERFTRKKHDPSFPTNAIAHALKEAGIKANELSAIGFYEKPYLKFFDRILQIYFKTWPWGYRQYLAAMKEWMTRKLWIRERIRKELQFQGDIYFSLHHESHAASAYFCSGFNDATIVTVDGVGEWATATIGQGKGNDMRLLKEIHYPHSLGLLYSAITYYLGFRVNSAEYKVMGLAPYGEPKYMKEMHELLDLKEDGSFALNMKYFCFEHGMKMTGKRMETLFKHPRREPETELLQFHKDIARSLQEITNEVMLKIVTHAKKICPSENLCLAGGVALNCVANGKILKTGLFKDIFIQPASGDAGGALGVAQLIWHRILAPHHTNPKGIPLPKGKGKEEQGKKTTPQRMNHAFFGTSYRSEEIEQFLKKEHLPYDTLSESELTERVSALLAGEEGSKENVIGWFQGRMEFGPRSLGNRSILADARNKENWKKVNLKIKFRESFRPFAPTVIEERASDYFDLPSVASAKEDRTIESPYMLLVADVKEEKRKEVPAITHVDGSARIQTINRSQNPLYYDLLKRFEERTGCPVIINTSFNIRGEPIVESPKDALNCFLNTEMDYLALGNCLLHKSKMPPDRIQTQKLYLSEFPLD